MKTIDLLVQLQAEQRTQHNKLVEMVEAGFATQARLMAEFDKRLTPIESMRSTLRTATGALFGAVLAFIGSAALLLWRGGVRG